MPDSGCPWPTKCFNVAIRCFLSRKLAVSLKAAHRGNTHARDEEWIFAVGLLDAAPARIAGNVDHRRERLVRAARARFQRGHGEKRLDQARD